MAWTFLRALRGGIGLPRVQGKICSGAAVSDSGLAQGASKLSFGRSLGAAALLAACASLPGTAQSQTCAVFTPVQDPDFNTAIATAPSSGTYWTKNVANDTADNGAQWTVVTDTATGMGRAVSYSSDLSGGTTAPTGLVSLTQPITGGVTGGSVVQFRLRWNNGVGANSSSNGVELSVWYGGIQYAQLRTPNNAATSPVTAPIALAGATVTTAPNWVGLGNYGVTTVRVTLPAGVPPSGDLSFGIRRVSASSPATSTTDDFLLADPEILSPTVCLVKQSNGGTGTFNFTTSNADADLATTAVDTAAAITTATPGTAAGFDAWAGATGAAAGITPLLVAGAGATVTLTETAPPAGFRFNSVSCSGNGAATYDTATRTATITGIIASATPATCTFVNDADGTLTVTKTVTGGPGSLATSLAFPFTVSCALPGASNYSGTVTVPAGTAKTASTTVSIPAGVGGCTIAEGAKPAAPGGYSWGTESVTNPAATAMPAGGTASASISNPLTMSPGTPFSSCPSTLYLHQDNTDTLTKQINVTTNPFTSTTVGGAGMQYNAAGFNALDNYVYAIRHNTVPAGPLPAQHYLIRISADGTAQDVAALPIPTSNGVLYNGGEIDPSGNMYIIGNNPNQFYKINLSNPNAPVVTQIPITLPAGVIFPSLLDLAWYNGKLWGVNHFGGGTSYQLYTIDPVIGSPGPNTNPVGSPWTMTNAGDFGAMYGAPNGVFGASNGVGGTTNPGFYQFDTTTSAATLISSTPGSINSDGSHCPSANILLPANLSISKTATPSGSYLPGQALNYSITVSNTGPNPVSGIGVTDTVPAAVTVTGWSCSTSGAGNDCDTAAAGTGAAGSGNAVSLPNVALVAGGSLTISISGTVQLNATGSIVNTATATPPAGTVCTTAPCTVSSSTTNINGGAPQLTLTKSASPAAFAIGQAATYTLQLGNTGATATSGTITISDPLPAGITTTATPSGAGWDCSASTSVQVNCSTIVILTPGSNAPPITVPVTIGTGTASPAVNTASASGGGDASCPAATRCQGTTSTPVNAPRLDVTKVLQGSFVVGVQSNYQITVTNNGQADTLGGTITDIIPTGLTLGPLPVGCTAVGQTVTCNLPAGISAGTGISYTIPVTPQASISGQSLINSATVNGGGDPTCPAAAHCTGTTTDTVEAPQLSLVKTASPTPFVVGLPSSYTLQVTNTGTAATTAAVTVSDAIPGGLSIGTLPPGCSAAGQIVTCTIAAGLATGTPVSFTIPVTPSASLSGLSVTNTATATGGGDPSCPVGAAPGTLPARCTGTVTTAIDAPQLTVLKTASAGSFVVNVPASYTLQVTNTGTAATTATATVSDTIPADLVIGTPLPADCSAAGQVVTCTIAAGLAAGTPVSFTIPVTPTAAASGQTLVNTASISGGGDPTCPGEGHCSSTTNTPVDAPQLTLVKTASAPNFVVDVPASYTLQVSNTGSAATTAAATVSDAIPAVLIPGAAPAGCSITGQNLSCTIPAGLAVNANVSFVIPVTPTAAASGTTVVNTATVSGGGDPTCPAAAHCSSTANTPVDAPQLTLVKTASAANFIVGVPASYTLQVSNTGSAATTAVAILTDTIPAVLTPGAAPGGCTLTGQNLSCTIPAGLSVGGSLLFTLPVTPAAAAAGSTVSNTATVSGGGDPTCPAAAHCVSTVEVPVEQIVNLAITKTATPAATYLPGEALSYTIVVSNNGPSPASGISVTDAVPAAVTVTGWSCTASGAAADCDTATAGTTAAGAGNAISLANVALGVGESLTIAVVGTVQLSATGAIVNTATAAPPAGAICSAAPCTVTATATNTDSGTPQLSLAKTATPGAFAVGQAATYSLQVSNTGSSSTSGAISLSDPLPSGITTAATPAGTGWDCSASTSTQVNCSTNAVLLPGSNAPPVSVPVAVGVGTASPAVNTASVSGGGDVSCPATPRCQASTSTPVNAPRLDVSKVLQGNLVVGVQSSYLVTVTNNGQADTLAGTLSDTIPAGLAIGVLPAGCTAIGQVVSCNLPAGLSAGTSISYAIPVTPQASTSGQSLSNSATVSGGGDPTCPAAAHCTGSTTDTVEAPQLSLVKSASPTPFVVGVQSSYSLQVTNTGTAATTAATTVSDTVPTGLSLGTLPAGCSAAGRVVTCTIAAGLATGTPVSFSIPVTPQASLIGLSVTNNATATGGGDPSCPAGSDASTLPARCTGSVTTAIDAPQLTITKTASAASFVVNVPASYTLQVTNTGSTATTAAATVSDTIPADLVIGTPLPAGCSRAGQVITCTIATGLATGTPVSFTIPVTPTAAASGQTLVNTASVSGGGDPTCPGQGHCSSTVNTPVDAPQLTLVKSASGSNFVVGVPASYTLQVTNTGSAATTAAATVSDTIPGTLTIGTPLPADCSAAGQVITCSIATGLASGTPVSFAIPVTPTAAASGQTLVNTASVSGGGDPTCPGQAHCDSSTTTPVNAPQLTLVKTASAANFVVGVPASYTLQVTNTGSAATTAAATVSDTIPGTLTIGTPLPADCSAAGQVITCSIAAGLATGTPVSFTIPVTPTAAASGQTLVNAASVSGGGDPTCPGQAHCDSSTTTPVNAPQLTLLKTANAANFVVGVPASYTLQVSNTGTAATTAAATISDSIPAGLTPGAAPAGCTLAGQNLSCTVPAGLGVGANVSFVIPVTPAAAASGTTVVNTATVSGGGDPTCPAAVHCSSTTNTPVDAPQLTIQKTASAPSFVVGVPASYTLQVTNTGTAATTSAATVSDTIPASLTPGAAPAGCTVTGQSVSCTIPAGLAAGADISFVIPVTPTAAASGTTVMNTATVSGGGDPTCPAAAHCSSTTDTPVDLIVNLAITKTAAPASTYLPGQALNYSIVVTNNGPSPASGISVADTVPAAVTISAWSCSASGVGADCDTAAAGTGAAGTGNAISLTSVVLGVGESLTLTVTGTADLGASGAIVNTATAAPPAGAICSAAPCTVTATATNTDSGTPQLSLAKTATPGAFAVGQAATYSLQVSNTGSSSTSGAISLSDPLPSGITTAATPAGTGWDCSASTSTQVNCSTNAVLLPGSNAPPVSVPVAVGVGTASPAVNTASVSGGGDASCPATPRCQASTSTPVNAPRLDVSKVLQGNLVVGVQSSYLVTVTNNGQADTLAGTLSDTIPAGLAIGVLPAGCTAIGQVVSCNLPAGLSAGTSISYAIPVTPQASTSGQSLSNSATVSGGGDLSCPAAAHCTGSTTDTVEAPQLSLVKSASPTPFVVGVQSSYSLQLTNTGTAATTAVTTISDTVPGGLAIGLLPAGCSAAGQLVTCTVAAGLATGMPVSFAIPVTPTAALSGLSVTNNATATGGGDPSCPPGADASALPPRCLGSVTTAVDAPQLTISKTASANSFVVNVPASYTLQVTNTGTAATTAAASVSDTVPADLVIGTPLPAGCSAAGQVVTCTVPAGLAAGTPVSFTIPVTPTAAASGQTLVNTASVSGGGDPTCPGAAHCSSTTNTPVDAPQLTLVKTASAAHFIVGVPASYTLQVSNTGSAATTAAAMISDTIPASLTPGAAPAGCTLTGQLLNCAIPAGLAAGAQVSFVITVTPAPAASGSIVVNSAEVSGGGDPTCPAAVHCSSSISTPVDAPQLTLVKTASAAYFIVGAPASYTLSLTNTGSAATTTAATISDPIPAVLIPGTAPAGCTLTGQLLSCVVPAGLAAGANLSFVIPVTPMAAASGMIVANTASVTGGGDTTCPAATRCSSSTNTPVDAPQLTISKTASAAGFVVGLPASYTLLVSNTGSAATTAAATLSDTIPAALTPGAAPAGCTLAGQLLSCPIPAGLAAGANVSFVVPVVPTAAASGTIVVNTASVSGGGDSSCPAAAHCSSSVQTPVEAPLVEIVKTVSDPVFSVGVPGSYTLTVTNIGSAATTEITTVTDLVPTVLSLGTSLPADCVATGHAVACTVAAGLAPDAAVGFVIPVTPTAAAAGTVVVNTATVSGNGCRGDSCSSTVQTPVDMASLSLVKTAAPAVFEVGQPASYTLTLTNTGSVPTVSAAVISDPMPAGLDLGVMPAGCAAQGPMVTCSVPAGLAPGAGVSFVLPVMPNASASGLISNTASVSGDSCPGPACTSSAAVPLGSSANLRVSKTDGGVAVLPGSPLSYTLTVSNLGPSPALAVMLHDPTPAGLDLISASAPCSGGFPCSLGGLASGTSVTVTVSYQVPAGYSGPRPISNTATVSSSTPDPDPANNSATDTTPVIPPTAERVPVPALGLAGLAGLAGLLALLALQAQRRRLLPRRPRA